MPPTRESDWLGSEPSHWESRLDELLARGRVADAVTLLDRMIYDRQLPLFETGATIEERRRLAWLLKVNLLRSLGRAREALAWTCLECELNPQNVAAHALKEQLKLHLRLTPESAARTAVKTHDRSERQFWAGVAGMRELKAILERDVILPLLQPDLYRKYRVTLPNGILLYGPPGCGKTFIAEKLGGLLGFRFVEVKPSDLGSIYVHGTQDKIGKLFHEARENAPTLLFLDELDALLPSRGNDVGHHYSAEVNEFLTQLNKASERRVLVVGATNRIDKIDPAALRPGRFDKKIFVGQPDLEARTELLRLYMADRPQDVLDYVQAAYECEGFTCAELEHVVNEAARRALEQRRQICVNDLMAAFAANPPAHAGERALLDEDQP
jgi:transitional endoplasmic reticulum ATPase